MKNLAIFASGGGTNAQSLIDFFKEDTEIKIALVVSENPDAFVLQRAEKAGIPTLLLGKDERQNADVIYSKLIPYAIDGIILAGYLKKIPDGLVALFPDRILNIHPSLLPKFGGKGMYGLRVHKAVIQAGENESGLTIHLVNERYDEGKILFQSKIAVQPEWTAEELQQAVLKLEHLHYPATIKKYFTNY